MTDERLEKLSAISKLIENGLDKDLKVRVDVYIKDSEDSKIDNLLISDLNNIYSHIKHKYDVEHSDFTNSQKEIVDAFNAGKPLEYRYIFNGKLSEWLPVEDKKAIPHDINWLKEILYTGNNEIRVKQ